MPEIVETNINIRTAVGVNETSMRELYRHGRIQEAFMQSRLLKQT